MVLTRMGEHDRFSHMPLNTSSTYRHLIKAMYEAYEISQKMPEPDIDLDLEGRDQPQFGNHANRRYGDKNATDNKHKTHATKGEIDDHFGWDQKNRKKDSQLHYHGRTERLKRARVTMFI